MKLIISEMDRVIPRYLRGKERVMKRTFLFTCILTAFVILNLPLYAEPSKTSDFSKETKSQLDARMGW